MPIFGLFSKKKDSLDNSSTNNNTDILPHSNETGIKTGEDFMPEVPPIEDLDIPPPPSFPKKEGTAQPVPAQHMPGSLSGESNIPGQMQAKQEKHDDFFTTGTKGNPKATEDEHVAMKKEVRAMHHMIHKEKPITEKIKTRTAPTGPIFTKVSDYKGILEGSAEINNNLKAASEIVTRLNELKKEEDKEFERWRNELEDIQKKLNYVDKIIFESS